MSIEQSSVAELVDEFERAGIRLWEESGELRFRAPRGALTDERRALVNGRREELIECLRERARSHVAVPDAEHRHDRFPLTDVQSAYLLGRRDSFEYGGSACQVYAELRYDSLDPPRLQAAWRALVERHGMLRATVHLDGYQQVHERVPDYEVAVADLREATAERLADHLAQARAAMDHRVYEPDRWPLFELRITRTPDGHLLHVSVDFLIADYLSIQLLLDELHVLYTGDGELPDLEIGFRDYLLAERALRETPAYEDDREYWTRRIDDLPAGPELALRDRDAEPVDARFARHQADFDAASWTRLQERARAHGVTGSTAVLAAFSEVIGRWSRHPRFTLNLTVLNRQALHEQVDRLVGDFTSVSLLAVEMRAAGTFEARARTLQGQVWADMDHRLYSGVELLREIRRRRGQAAALMPVVFTSTIGLRDDEPDPDPRRGTVGYGLAQTPQVWIDCQAVVEGDELQVKWDVRVDLFEPGLINDMFAAFEGLLRGLAADDALWDRAQPVALPPAQRERREQVNATGAPLPDELLHDGFLAAAGREPDRPALVAGDRTFSYGELLGHAAAVAAALRDAGCAAGALVGVEMEKGAEEVAGVLGVLLAGSAYLPIDASQPPQRRRRLLEAAGVEHVLTQSWLAAEGSDAIAVDELEPRAGPGTGDVAATARPDDRAYVIYTSGSTGQPKGVTVSHRSAVNTIQDINRRFAVGPDDRTLGLASLGFDLSVYDVFGTLAAGACLVLPDARRRGDPPHWAELTARQGVTVWNSVPAQMQMLTHYVSSDGADISSLRVALLSGDWIPTTLPDRVREIAPQVELVSLGGATEAAIWSIYHRIDETDPGRASIPYGRPLANQTFHVLDDALSPRPDGVTGELYIGGAGLAIGYLGDDEKTAERFITDPASGERLYRTGDLGRYLPDGEIEFLGREDRQVKIRGHRIELAEVEAALAEHPAVEAGVVVVDGEGADRRLAAFAQPARVPARSASLEQIETAASDAGDEQTDGVDRDELMEFMRRLDRAAIVGMQLALRRAGLFERPDDSYDLEEILQATGAAPRHDRLVRRWLSVLAAEDVLQRDDGGRYRALGELTDADAEAAWSDVEELQREDLYPAALIGYFKTSTERLPELIRDETDAVALLFPEGDLSISEAAYRDNVISRYVNAATIAMLGQIAEQHPGPGPLRIMEVGAGVGGTSAQLIPALEGHDVDYLFTDVSQFFLNEAAERFEQHPWVRFGLFDINAEPRAQGLVPNSFDLILCANVLHNSRHAGHVLARLRELLAPGGWLVFIETTRDSYQIMTSMELMMPDKDPSKWDYDDLRRGRDQTFLAGEQWRELLDEAGAAAVLSLPRSGELTAPLGQHAFAARFKVDRAPLTLDDLREHLGQRLPEYMVPAELQLVDELPLTANGKLDHDVLRGWLLRTAATRDDGALDEARDELERRLAELWSEVLAVPAVGRDQDFFQLGGDSLIIAKLAGRLRDEVPEATGLHWDDLVRQILNQPTVAELAERLRAGEPGGAGENGGAPAKEAVSPLLTLRDGDAPPVVLVHEGTGTMAPYRALVATLDEERPLAALAVNEIEPYVSTPAAGLIERLAGTYVRELRATEQTRFHVVGYCMGGLLATEVARQLTEGGASVESLTVISSYTLPRSIEDELVAEYVFAKVTGVDPESIGYPGEQAMSRVFAALLAADSERIAEGSVAQLGGDPELDDAAARFAQLAGTPQEERLAAIGQQLTASRPELDGAMHVAAMYRVVRHSLQAVGLHEPMPYAGDITFLRQTADTKFLPWLREDMTAFWREICLGELEVLDVPGDHFSCLQPPNVDRTAECLTAVVERTEAGR